MNQEPFAKITPKIAYSKKEQVLIMEIIENINIQQHDYIFFIAEITKPENIIFIFEYLKI